MIGCRLTRPGMFTCSIYEGGRMAIDMHAHYVPPKILSVLEREPSRYGLRLEEAGGGRCVRLDQGWPTEGRGGIWAGIVRSVASVRSGRNGQDYRDRLGWTKRLETSSKGACYATCQAATRVSDEHCRRCALLLS